MSYWDKFWKDEQGKTVTWQKPNLPIWVWIIATLASRLTSDGWRNLLNLVAFGAIVVWACLEIFDGANYFRRLLGVLVLAVSIYSKF